MHKVTMTAVKPGTEDAQDGFSNSLKPDSEKKTHGGSAIETIHSREPALYLNLTDTTQKISLFSINNDYREEEITGSDKLEYTVQNEDILTVTAGGVIQPKKAGITYVKAVYGGNESVYALIALPYATILSHVRSPLRGLRTFPRSTTAGPLRRRALRREIPTDGSAWKERAQKSRARRSSPNTRGRVSRRYSICSTARTANGRTFPA